MGFRAVVLLRVVLLFSCGNLCAATQNWFNLNNNETLDQIPQENVTTSLQLPGSPQTTDDQSNETELRGLVRPPVIYQLRTYQLRSPAISKKKLPQPPVRQMQTIEHLMRSKAGKPTSEQLQSGETDHAQELLKLPVQSPDLNSPVKQESKVLVKFEQRVPVPADSVSVHCSEEEVTVWVKQNFLGNSQLIHPSDLTLGGCAAIKTTDQVLEFQTELQGCGSTMTTTEEKLIYTFSLIYAPTPIGKTLILKTNPAEVVIECHYQRKHYVSSDALRPTWKLFASDMLAEQQLHFSLHLMTEDWQSQRASSVYWLNDVMHIEASVLQGHHVPLRVYADSCVATAYPNPNSYPQYHFISNHGCLTDAKLTGAKSYFMQRSQEDKLHFQLKAFRFYHDHRNSLYITCYLKATPIYTPITSQHKACSFLTEANRWVASDGDNKVCSCCETSCSEQRGKRSLAADADLQWEGMAALGPILLEENILEEQLTELSELPPEPVSLPHTQAVIQAVSYPSVALLCGVGAVLAVVLLVFTYAVTCHRLRKRTGHVVCT
ncbi:zona pellucida sperm-binding protein 3-like [Mastacembelus armatus]|uniref:zona pellucida sperm-binding protein 3-like n=1 Tax=Mastacembelus armatus TaxID=205130 RepID=UPI000E45CFF7|nr:zona pellucida sperm-binding protein 3-like [Mastacembelus armatus]